MKETSDWAGILGKSFFLRSKYACNYMYQYVCDDFI